MNNHHKPLIALFPGLGSNAASFNMMKPGLQKAFSNDFVIDLNRVEGMQSINLSIKQQAEVSFKELSDRVEDLGDRSILLIGHSQGALRAYAFLKQYGHLLNIKGLVALAAPWEGAPGARVDATMLKANLTDSVLDDLHRLSLSLGYPKAYLEEQLMVNVQANQAVCLCPGGKDLIAGSAFLSEVKRSLPGTKVPILAIGGGQGDFRALLPKLPKQKVAPFKALNDLYTFFVVGEKYLNNGHHDMQVPLYSQHALHILPKSKKHFKRVFIKDAFHSTHVLTMPVPDAKDILSHPRVLHEVIKFSKSILK